MSTSLPDHHVADGNAPVEELEALADALPILISRDDECPARWLSQAFQDEIASVRSRVASVADDRHLALRLAPGEGALGRGVFERATQRLAMDPVAVALAIRWMEIRSGSRLPTWTELLHRWSPGSILVTTQRQEPSSWFG